jgi:putative transcriptional regulator
MTVKELRELTGLSQLAFAKLYGIPKGTFLHWEAEERKPPKYAMEWLERIVKEDFK